MAARDDSGRVVDILLVEDNPGDVRLAQEALKGSQVANRLFVVDDGVEAMDFLQRRGKHAGAPRPDLILLDLNLPRMGGRELLEKVKSDQQLRRIPVVVLTVSTADEDVAKCYDHHANCYITKPLDFNQFVRISRAIEEFWLSTVTLPPK